MRRLSLCRKVPLLLVFSQAAGAHKMQNAQRLRWASYYTFPAGSRMSLFTGLDGVPHAGTDTFNVLRQAFEYIQTLLAFFIRG